MLKSNQILAKLKLYNERLLEAKSSSIVKRLEIEILELEAKLEETWEKEEYALHVELKEGQDDFEYHFRGGYSYDTH